MAEINTSRTPVKGNINNIIGFVNENEASISEMMVKNLYHKSLGILFSSKPNSTYTAKENVGTYAFTIHKQARFRKYTKATRKGNADLPKKELLVKIDVSGSAVARTELETLDQNIITNAAQFASEIAASHSTSMAALLDAHFLELAQKTAEEIYKIFIKDAAGKPTTTRQYPLSILEIEKLDDIGEDEKAQRKVYRALARAKVAISRQLDSFNLGTNPTDYAVFLHQNLLNDLVAYMPKGGDSATSIGRKLATAEGATIVAGLGICKDHIFLGQNIPAGTNFSEDDAFNFTNIYGLIAHREAFFVRPSGLQTSAARDPYSGNVIVLTKFNYFKGVVRKELFTLIKLKKTAKKKK